MSLGRKVWREVRAVLQSLLHKEAPESSRNLVKKALVKQSEVYVYLHLLFRLSCADLAFFMLTECFFN
jgi:hypothetical protein